MIISIYFLLFTITRCFSSYVIISSKLNSTTFKYWDGICISNYYIDRIEDIYKILYIEKICNVYYYRLMERVICMNV